MSGIPLPGSLFVLPDGKHLYVFELNYTTWSHFHPNRRGYRLFCFWLMTIANRVSLSPGSLVCSSWCVLKFALVFLFIGRGTYMRRRRGCFPQLRHHIDIVGLLSRKNEFYCSVFHLHRKMARHSVTMDPLISRALSLGDFDRQSPAIGRHRRSTLPFCSSK